MRRNACLFSVVLEAAILAGMTGPATAQRPEAKVQVAEEHTTRVLPLPNAHRVYVVDPVFPHLIAGKTYVVDGDTQEVLGQINAGYFFNLTSGPDRSELYVVETYWSRGTRGKRTDLVTIYDSRQLSAREEIVLPRGRFLVVTKEYNVDVTPDGGYLLSFNMDPRTSVSVVDLRARRYIGEVEVPGCALVFSLTPNRFSMLCADGSLLMARFDSLSKATTTRSKPFFNPNEDPVFEHPAISKASARIHFVSYEGKIHPVHMPGNEPSFGEPWSLLNDEDSTAKWRPGGWQLAAIHAERNRLYVLMHQGPKWTHKQAGTEVWVYDLAQKKRVERLRLVHQANSIAVSQDTRPQLYALSETGTLQIYDADSLRYLGIVGDLGDSPLLLHVGGQ